MKLIYFDDFKLGVLAGDMVIDVTAIVQDVPHTNPGNLMNGLIARFGDYRRRLEDAAAGGGGVPLSSVRVRPPVPGPTTIDCMAVNYMEDGTRAEPAPINAFHKSPGAIIGHGDTMVLPDVPATVFEGEAELAVVIGKTANNISAANAMDHVFGYMNFIDGSARALPPPGNTFFQVKSRETFAPIGPWLVTARENESQFEWAAHEPAARSAGLAAEVIDIVRHRRATDGLGETEAVVIALGREIFARRRVAPETFAAALRLFGRRGLVDLVSLMGQYAATAAILIAFDQQLGPGQEPPLPDTKERHSGRTT